MLSPKSTEKIAAVGIGKTLIQDGNPLRILDRINFSAYEGEIVSIIGPSGCGKSTLLNILAGLEDPDTGSISVQGLGEWHRLGNIGYMQQKDLLLPWRSVLDNVTLGLEIQGIPRAERRAEAAKHLASFGLSGFEKEYPYALSGGMRQRASFLRAILTKADVLLLDEPFSALDALNRVQLQNWLLDILDSMKRTVVLVTHDVEEAIYLSDRVYVMSSLPGKIETVENIPFPRPRKLEILADLAFVEQKTSLLSALKEGS